MMIAKSFNRRSRIISIVLIFVLTFSLVFLNAEPAIAVIGKQETMGAWETVPLPSPEERIQSVHTTLLPNGKVLMVNGSSFS